MSWLFNFKKKQNMPTSGIGKLPNSNTPIREVRFVVLDTETTGLDRKKDQILSVGALGIQDYQIKVGPCLDIEFPYHQITQRDSIAIHGIVPSNESLTKMVRPNINPIVDFLDASIIVICSQTREDL